MHLPDDVTRVSNRLDLRVITSAPEFTELRDEWNRALERSADPNIFLTWEWLACWWRHFGADGELHVIVVRDADELVLGVPLMRVRGGRWPASRTVVRQVSHDAGDYGGAVLAPGHEPAMRLLLEHLDDEVNHRRHVLVLSRLASDSMFLAAVEDGLGARHLDVHGERLEGSCPYTDVSDGFDLERTAKKHKVFQRLRRLNEQYEPKFHFHTGPDLEEGLDWLLDVHGQRWANRSAELQGQFASAAHERFLLDAVGELDREGWIRLISLSVEGRPIAVDLCFEYAARLSMFKGAIDPEFSRFSPGQLVTYQSFTDGIARGDTIFDFMRGDHDYKQRWTNGERHLVTLTVTRTGVSGRLDRARHRAATAIDSRQARPERTD